MSDTVLTEGTDTAAPDQVQDDATVTDSQADNEPAVVGAPDSYEDFTFPEGVEVDKELLAEFTPLAKELNLPQEKAQQLVDLYVKQVQEIEDGRVKGWETLQEQWVNGAKSDKEYGGVNFEANAALARKAVDKFGTDDLKEMLNVTGTGNHPELLRFMYRVGKAISEDEMKSGQPKPQGATDLAHRIYPNMN